MTQKFTPLAEKDRTISIDVLRGFALLGILMVNMQAFHSPALYIDTFTYWPSQMDQFFLNFVQLFAEGSFYPLFAFLFGYGAMIIADRSAAKGIYFPTFFARRLAILLVIGCIHAFLIWNGDILMMYAITGIFFIFFYKFSGKTLLRVGLLIYSLPMLFMFLPASAEDPFGENPTAVQRTLDTYSSGSIIEIIQLRTAEWATMNLDPTAWTMAIGVFGLMLIGAAFAKLKWLVDVKTHKRLLMLLLVMGLILGLGMKFTMFLFPENFILMVFQTQFSGAFTALFYLTSIVLLVQTTVGRKMLQPFANVGRFSMSNYLLQSIAMTTLFYSYGFGLFGSISYTTGFAIVFGFFTLQILLSKWWAPRFQYGPIEYIWRWGTYGKKPTFKKIYK